MKKISPFSKICLLIFGILIIGISVLSVVAHRRHIGATATAHPTTANDATPKGVTKVPDVAPPSASSPTTPTASNSTAKSGSSSSAQSDSLVAPTGTFSNVYTAHADDQMGSTCNTTPTATCAIVFTNGALSFSLPAQIVNGSGGTLWAWKPSQIGLTRGTWHIVARATLAGQVKESSNDPLTLKVF